MVDGEWVVAEVCGGRWERKDGFQMISPNLHCFYYNLSTNIEYFNNHYIRICTEEEMLYSTIMGVYHDTESRAFKNPNPANAHISLK